jgi:hypothetical protein
MVVLSARKRRGYFRTRMSLFAFCSSFLVESSTTDSSKNNVASLSDFQQDALYSYAVFGTIRLSCCGMILEQSPSPKKWSFCSLLYCVGRGALNCYPARLLVGLSRGLGLLKSSDATSCKRCRPETTKQKFSQTKTISAIYLIRI